MKLREREEKTKRCHPQTPEVIKRSPLRKRRLDLGGLTTQHQQHQQQPQQPQQKDPQQPQQLSLANLSGPLFSPLFAKETTLTPSHNNNNNNTHNTDNNNHNNTLQRSKDEHTQEIPDRDNTTANSSHNTPNKLDSVFLLSTPPSATLKRRRRRRKTPTTSSQEEQSGNTAEVVKRKAWEDAVSHTSRPPVTRPILHPLDEISTLHTHFKWLLWPKNIFSFLLVYSTVAPLTLLTPMNLYYQLYLNEIFHTTFTARFLHFLMMPCITWTYLLFACQFSLPSWLVGEQELAPIIVGEARVDMFAIRGNAVLALVFLTWYIVWGIRTKTYGFGFFTIPTLTMMWILSNIFYDWTKYPTGGTWYNSAPLWANPLTVGTVFALIQTLSHIAEPFPPRANGTDHWMTFGEFWNLHKSNVWSWFFYMLMPALLGTVNEFLAGPRLFPLLVLKQMYMLGYRQEQWQEIQQIAEMARALGDPAIDYFGEGGSLPPSQSHEPKSARAAKHELKELEYRASKKQLDEDAQARMKYLRLLILKAKFNRLVPGVSFFHNGDNTTTHNTGRVQGEANTVLGIRTVSHTRDTTNHNNHNTRNTHTPSGGEPASDEDDRAIGLRMVRECLLNRQQDERMLPLPSLSPQLPRTITLTSSSIMQPTTTTTTSTTSTTTPTSKQLTQRQQRQRLGVLATPLVPKPRRRKKPSSPQQAEN